MLNLKSWSQEHPREPLLLLVVLCAVLTGYVYTASPAPHYDHSAQVKSTVAKTLPTAGPLPVEAPVRRAQQKPVSWPYIQPQPACCELRINGWIVGILPNPKFVWS